MPKYPQDAADPAASAAVHAAQTPILFALVTCPALLIPFGENPFEPHKAAFLWTATAAACAAIIGSPTAWRRLGTTIDNWGRLMVICAGLAIIAMLVSTALSEAPRLAWWGSPQRAHGTLTALSVLLGLIVMLVIMSPEFVEQLHVAVIVGSIGPTLYGLYQARPLTWDIGELSRASGTLGNPLFFAGYLVTVWPLTLGRAIIQLQVARRSAASRACSLGLWLLFGLQSAALLAARSRGPVLALMVATALGGLLACAVSGRIRLARVLAGITLATAVSFAIVAPARMRGPEGGTAMVRLILWEAVARGISAHAKQMAFGLGPESTTALMSTYAGSELRRLEGPNTVPDRAHNDTLERLASFGAIGVALQLAMAGITLGAALTGLRLLARAGTRTFVIFAVIVLIGASAAATGSGGGLWALAVVAPAAAVIAFSGWIAWRPEHDETDAESPGWHVAVMIAAATVAWLAHLIEISLSIETVASSFNAVAAAAIVVALAARERERSAHVRPTSAPANGDARDAMALLVGWSVAELTIGLSEASRHPKIGVWAIAIMAWTLAMAIVGAGARGIVRSVVVWLTVVFVCLWWLDSSGGPSPYGVAVGITDRLRLFYVLAGLCMVAAVAVRRPLWSSAPAVAVIVGVIVGAYAIRVTSADVLMQSAAVLQASDPASAIALYRQAGERNPSNARAFTHLADALMGQADTTADPAARVALFREANDGLAQARVADPFEYHHPRNLAALHRRWARVSALEDWRTHYDEADRSYRAATELAPNAALLWVEWANLEAERGRMTDALAKLERAASLGATTEVVATCDAIMRVQGQEIGTADKRRQVSLDLKGRGYPALAALYARAAR